jgi:hypothetical protein
MLSEISHQPTSFLHPIMQIERQLVFPRATRKVKLSGAAFLDGANYRGD